LPILPPPTLAAPYDTLESVLNLSRVRLNDAIASLAGDIITDAQPFTAVMAQGAWRAFQEYLANMGSVRFKKPLMIQGYPPVGSIDPASWTALTWQSFFDGRAFWVPPDVGVLPQDFIMPLKMWERANGTNSTFCPMEQAVEAIPDCRKGPFNGSWYWENDTLYMPGSIYSMDLRWEYAAYLADFQVNSDGTVIGAQQVPVMRALNPLAWYFCAEAAEGRDDVDKDTFIAKAEKACRMLFNREVAMKQRRPVSRRGFSSHHRQSYGVW
jgi:hypothetical protein